MSNVRRLPTIPREISSTEAEILDSAQRIDADIVRHAPRVWGNRLLAMCLRDAWNSEAVPDELVEYTQAAIPRARGVGMTLRDWVEAAS